MTDPKIIYQTGLQMEIEAHRYYTEHAGRARNPGTREMLLELAAEEQGHVRLFQAALEGRTVELGRAAPRRGQDLRIGETLRDDIVLTERSGPGEVLVVAIRAEMNAIRVYGAWADEHRGTPVEALLRAIAAEEESHRHRLEKLYDEEYLKDN